MSQQTAEYYTLFCLEIQFPSVCWDGMENLIVPYSHAGNATVHAIQELIKSTDQADLGLTLDLHCNKLGAGALLEVSRLLN